MKSVVVIPTYNEKNNINVIIPAIFKFVPEINVLVVDDNSPDGTAGAVKDLQKQYPNLQLIERTAKNGLGRAYIHAFKEIMRDGSFSTIIMMDADLSHDPKHLPEMISLREKYDVVVGSRYIKGGRTEGWELWRRILSRFGNLYAKVITRMPVSDCTGGFNAIDIELLKKIDFETIDVAGYAFIMHLKYVLFRLNARFIEIPICFKNRVEGVSKISNSIIREGVLAPWKMALSSPLIYSEKKV